MTAKIEKGKCMYPLRAEDGKLSVLYIDVFNMMLFQDADGLIPAQAVLSVITPEVDQAYRFRVRASENDVQAHEYYVAKADNNVLYKGAAKQV